MVDMGDNTEITDIFLGRGQGSGFTL
jgi:hypothetical protein